MAFVRLVITRLFMTKRLIYLLTYLLTYEQTQLILNSVYDWQPVQLFQSRLYVVS